MTKVGDRGRDNGEQEETGQKEGEEDGGQEKGWGVSMTGTKSVRQLLHLTEDVCEKENMGAESV